MLPDDTKVRREAALARTNQPSVADVFAGVPKPLRYTHAGFQDAAIEWLIDTDQVSNH